MSARSRSRREPEARVGEFGLPPLFDHRYFRHAARLDRRQVRAPLQEIVPVVIQPVTLPPPEAIEKKPTDEDKDEPPQVAVVIPQAPNISFSVPTIGSLVVPASLATAPPVGANADGGADWFRQPAPARVVTGPSRLIPKSRWNRDCKARFFSC